MRLLPAVEACLHPPEEPDTCHAGAHSKPQLHPNPAPNIPQGKADEIK